VLATGIILILRSPSKLPLSEPHQQPVIQAMWPWQASGRRHRRTMGDSSGRCRMTSKVGGSTTTINNDAFTRRQSTRSSVHGLPGNRPASELCTTNPHISDTPVQMCMAPHAIPLRFAAVSAGSFQIHAALRLSCVFLLPKSQVLTRPCPVVPSSILLLYLRMQASPLFRSFAHHYPIKFPSLLPP